MINVLRVLAVFSWSVASSAGQLPAILTTSLPAATTGAAYAVPLSATGGTPPYSNWTVGVGALPAGLTLDPATGKISGTPSVSGVFNIWVTVQDSAQGISPAQPLTITASVPAVTTTSLLLPSSVLNTAYYASLTASGGTPPYVNWTVASGTLPQGLALNASTGVISGTPIAIGAYNFSVTVQDSTGVTSMAQPLMLVTGVAITTTSLPKATVNAPYSAQLAASGGLSPYTSWVVSGGVLPPGLTLAGGAGLLSGIPTDVGSYSFSITVSDSAGVPSLPQPYTLVVASVPTITTGALKPGLPGVPYSATLTASGGSLPLTWAIVSGNLPAGLNFSPGLATISGTPQSPAGNTFNFTVQVTDSVGVTSFPQLLSIAISQASLTLSPTSLTFNARLDDSSPPPVQSISVFSLAGPVTFTATASTTSGGNWLSIVGGGRTPGNILVSANTSGLTANTTYHGLITIAGQNINASTIPVTLVIAPGGGPLLSVSPASLPLSYVQGNAPDQRYLVVNNLGGGTLHFTAQTTTDSCGSSWLNLLNSSGSAAASGSGVIAVSISSSGLSDRTCVGAVTITDSGTGESQKIPVTMTVSAQNQSLLLTQSGMAFQAGVGSSPPPQTFTVLNTGVGSAAWTASSQTLTGANWLSVTPASGTATSGVVPGPVTVSVNSQGLPPGQYYGSVPVAASSVGNSPQAVSVMLTVSSAAPPPPPLSPSGVILIGQSSGSSQAENVSLFNPWNTPLAYSSTVVTDNRVSWLTQTPASGTIAPGATATVALQASLKGLTPGLQHGVVRVAFVDGTVHTVDVYLIVPATAPSANLRTSTELLLTPKALAQACPGSSGTVVVLRTPEPGFQATAQVPVPVQLMARDCSTGKLIRQSGGASAQVLIGSKTPAAIVLTDDGSGVWTGTWTPSDAPSQITLSARVDQYVGAIAAVQSGQDVITGSVAPPPDGAAGVVTNVMNGASFQSGSVTPGAWVSLFGVGIGDTTAAASQTPFPSTLAGTQVLLQGQPLPLYFVNSTQVNALIPTGVSTNERQQLVVRRNGTQSAGIDVRVANLQPGIFTVNQQGTGQGAITVGSSDELAGPARPAKRGEFVSIYCTGLGPVSNAPRDGSLAPASPLATTTQNPMVTIGGVPVPAVFSGLTPLQVGLYQVNVQVPQSSPAGDAVPVVVTIGSAVSNTATIAVQ